MDAYSVETTVQPDGSVRIEALPFHAGERVQVIVLAPAAHRSDPVNRYPLQGTVYHYERPFDPVAGDDWEVNQWYSSIPTSGSGGFKATSGYPSIIDRLSAKVSVKGLA